MVEEAMANLSRPTFCIIGGTHGNTMQCNTTMLLTLTCFLEHRRKVFLTQSNIYGPAKANSAGRLSPSVEVHISNSRRHTEAWESISPTQGATPKRGSPYPQLKGPHQSVGVHRLNSRGHTEAWDSISATQGATPKRGNPSPQLKGPHRSVGVHHPNPRGRIEAWEYISTNQGATLKRGSPSLQLKEPH